MYRSWLKILSVFFLAFGLGACASKVLEYENVDQLEENREYEDLVKVEALPAEESGQSALEKKIQESKVDKNKKDIKTEKKEIKQATDKVEDRLPPRTTIKLRPKDKKEKKPEKEFKKIVEKTRQPEYEDSENFSGRRPLKDPFRVGEKVTLSLTYFNITAGTMDLSVKPFVQVNGEKAYHFEVDIKSNSFFSRIYTVDDKATTYLDYETILPFNLDIRVRESKQIKEIRSFLNNKTLEGSYWEKKVTKEKGEQEKSTKWKIKPYSQNVISAVYYLRTFTLTPGKKLQFRVADDGKNYMFKAEVVRKEKLKTDQGLMKTVVVKPQISIGGAFKPVGEILIWLTDDDRKFPVRIESKIKIGTIIAKLKKIDYGVAE